MPNSRPLPAAGSSVVIALMLGVATVGATIFAVSPLLVDIAAAFSVTVAQAGVLPGVFSMALAVVAPVVALGARRLPRLWLVVGGLACFAAAWAGALLVRDFPALLAFVALAGAATGAVLPAVYALAGDLAGEDERARVMGRVVSGWSIAILVVVPSMALAAHWVDWRWAFGALAGAALSLALWLGALMRGATRRSARAIGSLRSWPPAQATLSAQADPSAESDQLARPDPSAPAVPSLRESLRIVLTDRPTLIILAANLLDMGAFYAVFSFAGAELRRANDWGALPAGLMVAGYGLGLAIVTFNARLIDRWGMQRTGVGALLALALVLPALPWLVGTPSLFAVGAVLWGCLQGAFFTSITTLATSQIPPLRGVVAALLSSATYLGVTAYTPLSTRLYAGLGYPAVGALAGLGCVIAALLLARLPRSAPVPTAGSRPRSR